MGNLSTFGLTHGSQGAEPACPGGVLNPNTGNWDKQLMEDTFWPEDAAIILNIPTYENVADWPAWHFGSKGIFSVKSAYKLAMQLRDEELGRNCSTSAVEGGGLNFEWHKIWQLPYPNKVKMFIWRLAHNSLPVKRNLVRRRVRTDTVCPVCKRLDEDSGHLFFKCKRAKEC
jgi:hypothetical protein